MSDAQKYTDADVRAIVERALRDQGEPGINHADLLSLGTEVGISPSAMDAAAQEVAEARRDVAARQYIAQRRRRGLALHGLAFALLNALLFAVNFLTTPGEWWVLFPVVFWGLALGLHAGWALGAGVSQARLTRERKRLEAERTSLPQRLRVDTAAASGPPLAASVPSPEPVAVSAEPLADEPAAVASASLPNQK